MQTESRNMEAHLLAKDLRKVGFYPVSYTEWGKLMRTPFCFGMSRKPTCPAFIKVRFKFIRVLQECDLYIFITTHNYLLTYMLSLYSKFEKQKDASVKFFGPKNKGRGIMVEKSKFLADIQNNSTLKEYVPFYTWNSIFLSV